MLWQDLHMAEHGLFRIYFGIFRISGYGFYTPFSGYCTGFPEFVRVTVCFGFRTLFWSSNVSGFMAAVLGYIPAFFRISAMSMHNYAYGCLKTPCYSFYTSSDVHKNPGLTGMVLNCRRKRGLPGIWTIKVCVAPEVSTDLWQACSLPQAPGIISQALKQNLGIQSLLSIFTQKWHPLPAAHEVGAELQQADGERHRVCPCTAGYGKEVAPYPQQVCGCFHCIY